MVRRYWLLTCPVTFARRIRLAYQTLCTEHVKLLSLCFTGCSTPSGRCVTSDGRPHALVPCGSCLLRSSTETNTICLVSGVCFSGLRDSPDHDDYLCVAAQADEGRALPARKTRHIVQIGPFFLLCSQWSHEKVLWLSCWHWGIRWLRRRLTGLIGSMAHDTDSVCLTSPMVILGLVRCP